MFWLLAKRRRLYAYLIAPTVWTMAGALGLYLHFHWIDEPGLDRPMPEGMSAYQIVLILAAMAATVLVAILIRQTSLGKLVSVPTVRAAVAVAPFVLVAAIQFAYSDAVTEGLPGVRPGLEQMDLPVALAAAATGALYLVARRARFAWEGLPGRAQRDLPEVAAVLGSVALGAAAGLGFSDVVPLPWAGVILCGAGVGLAAAERIPGFGSRSGSWVAAATDGRGPGALTGERRRHRRRLGPGRRDPGRCSRGPCAPCSGRLQESESVGRLLVGATTLVALGAGVARLAWPEGTVWVLVGSAALLGGTKFLERLPPGSARWPRRRRRCWWPPPWEWLRPGPRPETARATPPRAAWSWPPPPPCSFSTCLGWRAWCRGPPCWPPAAWWRCGRRWSPEPGSGRRPMPPCSVFSAWAWWPMPCCGARAATGCGTARWGICWCSPPSGAAWATSARRWSGWACSSSPWPPRRLPPNSDRSVLLERLAALPGAVPAWRALPAAAAAAALPFLTVLAGQRIPAVAAEAERRGLVLAVTALGFAAAVLVWRRRARLRAVAAVGGTAIALAGIAWPPRRRRAWCWPPGRQP